MRITAVRYGKVVPNPHIKFSTIKLELEAEVDPNNEFDNVYRILKKKVNDLLKEEE